MAKVELAGTIDARGSVKQGRAEAEPLPLRKCAGCGSTTFEIKRLAQMRGAEYINGYDEVRCTVCERILKVE